MSRRRSPGRGAVSPGAVTRLCPPPCGNVNGGGKPCCRSCWNHLPHDLAAAWLAAAPGSTAQEEAALAVRDHLRAHPASLPVPSVAAGAEPPASTPGDHAAQRDAWRRAESAQAASQRRGRARRNPPGITGVRAARRDGQR
jgi:hypothetical protein